MKRGTNTRITTRSTLWLAGLLLVSTLVTGCDRRGWGLPRIAVAETSEDGQWLASVRNHPSIDPPRQSLWIESPDGDRKLIAKLGEDTHWCNAIHWSADNSRVAFVINDASLMVVDAASGEIVGEHELVEHDHVPTSRKVIEGELSATGDQFRYIVERRRGGGDRESREIAI